jgi:hypothetical protein
LKKLVDTWLNNNKTWDDIFALFEQEQEQTSGHQRDTLSTETSFDYSTADLFGWPQSNNTISSSTPFAPSDVFQGRSTSYNVEGATIFNPPHNPIDPSTFFRPESSSMQDSNFNNPYQYTTNGENVFPGTGVQYSSNLLQNPVYPPVGPFPAGPFLPPDPSYNSDGNGPTGMHNPYNSYQ